METHEVVMMLEEAGYTQEEIDELMQDLQIPTVVQFPNVWHKE